MNMLSVGADKTPILDSANSSSFLLIDDGPLIDALKIPPRRKVKHFDVQRHHINPLDRMNDVRAEEFISVLDARFPEGESTLMRKNSNYILLKALLKDPTYLDVLLHPDKKDAAAQDAYQKIDTLLMSPVLRGVLCKRIEPFALRGIVLAKLDRAVIGDKVAFVLGNLLISQYKGQVIVPDFGFYGREHHIALIRQNRLVAGLTSLSEVPVALRQALLTIPDKRASRALFDDAELLAKYEGLRPEKDRDDSPYNEFVRAAMA